MRKIFCTILMGAALAWTLGAQTGKPAYSLYGNDGKEVSYRDMVKELARHEVVFIGEMHNCPITHWLEYEIAKSLYKAHGDRLAIGAEMLESDNQLILDEYMRGLISYDRFEEEARLWPNYSTDYYPVVYFAKENGIPFVATNVPRRYANSVKNGGFEALDSFSDEAKRYMAPLPIRFGYDAEESEAAFSMMNMLGGRHAGDTEKLAMAQALKDATMAWFISSGIPEKGCFLHINGSYHSDSRGGIIPYLLEYRPDADIVTVTAVRQEDIGRLSEENKGRADFYICVPEDMVTSY